MTDENILVVCAANVCRSPLAELALRRGLGSGAHISVTSAGVRANAGDPICPLVEARHEDEEWQAQVQAHRARPVTLELIEQSSIVLAASRDVRSDLVRIAPRARDRMFTIKEAAYLGAGFSSSAPDRIAEYVAYLDRARSRAVPLTAPTGFVSRLRNRFGARSVTDPVSIADRHGSHGHAETISEVEAAVAEIVTQLGGHRRHS